MVNPYNYDDDGGINMRAIAYVFGGGNIILCGIGHISAVLYITHKRLAKLSVGSENSDDITIGTVSRLERSVAIELK